MRSAGRRDAVEAGEPAQQGKVAGGVVNDVLEVDPRGYREAMRSRHSMLYKSHGGRGECTGSERVWGIV